MNDKWPNEHEPALGWRIFRIEYINEDGHSNIEGQLLFPPEVDPYPLLDHIEDYFNKRLSTVEETDEMEDHPEECRCEVCRFWS